MRLVKTLALVCLLAGQCGFVWAGDAVRAFASELMLHESKQVLQPDRPLKYSDPEGGAALRALLAPARTKIVMDDFLGELQKDPGQPDVTKLVGPLVKRYEKAFTADPRAYEEEYLDALNWVVSPLEGAARISAASVRQNAAATGPDAEAAQKLLESLQGLSDSLVRFIAKDIRDKANSGVYSAAGKVRALAMADRPVAVLPPAPPAQARSAQQAPAAAVSARDIEERFSRRSLLAADALEQLQKCNASTPRQRYEELIENTKKGRGVTGFLGQTGAPKVVGIADQYWTCVSFSATGNAILPVEVLRNTVTTVGASPAGLAAWRRELLAELATNGKAQGLVELRGGSAQVASYTLSREGGANLSYETSTLLKAGTYNRADYKVVISEPSITGVVLSYVGESKAKNSAMLLAPLARVPLTSDGFIPIAGNAATASTNFAGNVWLFESVSGPGSLLRLSPGGIATYERGTASQTGQWKVTGNALQVYVNPDVYYSLALTEDGRFLQGEVRRKEMPSPKIQGVSSIPQHDDFDPELRFKISRLYRDSDAEYEKVMAVKREAAKQDALFATQRLFAQAEVRKTQILAETPEQEAAEQAKIVAQNGKPEYTWRVCDGSLQSQLMMAKYTSPTAVADFAGKTIGDVCYAWLGTRKDWKATILQQGCNGRCQMQ